MDSKKQKRGIFEKKIMLYLFQNNNFKINHRAPAVRVGAVRVHPAALVQRALQVHRHQAREKIHRNRHNIGSVRIHPRDDGIAVENAGGVEASLVLPTG